MKKIHFFLASLFIIAYDYSAAQGVATTVGQLQTAPVVTTGPGNTDDICGAVPVQFRELRFMGLRLPGRAVSCVKGKGNSLNAEVRQACNGLTAVNPGDPRFSVQGMGTKGTNSEGYFYCVADTSLNWEEDHCKNRLPIANAGQGLAFFWNPAIRGGACGCAPSGTSNFNYACSESPRSPLENLSNTTSAGGSGEIVVTGNTCRSIGLLSYDPSPFPVELEDGTYCKCTATGTDFFRIEEARGQCFLLQNPATTNQPATVASAAGPAVAPTDEAQFRSCLNSWTTLSRNCKQHAEDANRVCQTRQSRNEDINAATGILSGLGQSVNSANSGQGTQDRCFTAGASILGAREALNTTRESCDIDFQVCQRECTSSRVDEFLAACPVKIHKTATQIQAETGPLTDVFNTSYNEIRENFENGVRVCQTDVRRESLSLNGVVSDLGRTLQASAKCACKTSSTGGQNCDAIPTIEVCQSSNNSNCSIYGSIASCAVGSVNYDSQVCACERNPGTTGCAALRDKTASQISTFSSGASLPQASNGGAASFGGTGSSGKASGGNFGDLSSGGGSDAITTNFANNLKAGDTSPSSGGSGAGGAPASGAGASASNTPLAELPGGPVAEKATGLSGLFNQIKTSIAGVLGGSRKNTKVDRPIAELKPDFSKFKPKLRGGIQQRDLASANEKTLFELVNECVNGARCKSNTKDSFILEP